MQHGEANGSRFALAKRSVAGHKLHDVSNDVSFIENGLQVHEIWPKNYNFQNFTHRWGGYAPLGTERMCETDLRGRCKQKQTCIGPGASAPAREENVNKHSSERAKCQKPNATCSHQQLSPAATTHAQKEVSVAEISSQPQPAPNNQTPLCLGSGGDKSPSLPPALTE